MVPLCIAFWLVWRWLVAASSLRVDCDGSCEWWVLWWVLWVWVCSLSLFLSLSLLGVCSGVCALSVAGFGVTCWRFVVVILLFIFDALRRAALGGHEPQIRYFPICMHKFTHTHRCTWGKWVRGLCTLYLSISLSLSVSPHHALAQNQWARLSKQSQSENKTKEPKQTTNEYSLMSTSTHTHTLVCMCASGLGSGSGRDRATSGVTSSATNTLTCVWSGHRVGETHNDDNDGRLRVALPGRPACLHG